MMCNDALRPLTFETMLTDPIVRLMMQADGVGVAELIAAMRIAQAQVAARERLALSRACESDGTAGRI
ncbi:MAG: hypothetical protein J0I21_06560 [Alphaproteobacteria bacterium]|nr:hypothetical protein [Alphaproteobacteria bacterium]